MDDAARVDVLEPAEGLVQQELRLVEREPLLRLDEQAHVRLHQLVHAVDVLEVGARVRQQDRVEPDHVRVVHQPQQLQLAQRALRVEPVLEGLLDFLDRDGLLLFVLLDDRGRHHSVGALADLLDELVALVDHEDGVVQLRLLLLLLTLVLLVELNHAFAALGLLLNHLYTRGGIRAVSVCLSHTHARSWSRASGSIVLEK